MLGFRSTAFNIVFYAATIVMVVAFSPCLLLPRRSTVKAMRLWSRITLAILRIVAGTTYEVRGLENLPKDGRFIIAAKHQSMWDTIVYNVIVDDPAMVLKRELLYIPFYGWYSWKTNMIAVDRGAGASAMRSLIGQGKAAVAAARPIVIFPEGTRSAVGAEADYKPGIAALYRQLGVPCVPAAVNSGFFWPRRQMTRRPGTVILEFLPAIPPGLDRATFMAELSTRIESQTEKLLAEAGYRKA